MGQNDKCCFCGTIMGALVWLHQGYCCIPCFFKLVPTPQNVEQTSQKCGLCQSPMTRQELNDCRAADLKFEGGTYFHNRCWNRMIAYAEFRGWISKEPKPVDPVSPPDPISQQRC